MNRAVDIYVDAVTRRNDVLGEGIVDLVRATTRSIATLYRSVQTERRRRASIRNLNALNDHHLRDIGLTRYEMRYEIAVYVKQHMAGHAVSSEHPSLVQHAGHAVRAAQRPFKIWHGPQLRDPSESQASSSISQAAAALRAAA